MRAAFLIVGIISVFFSMPSHAALVVNPTTTLTAETSNNTSAANNFPQVWTYSNGNAFGNVSKISVKTMLASSANTRIFAHYMPWFGSGSHKNTGYSEHDPSQIARQIRDMISRGIEGMIIDWYGPNTWEDGTTDLVMQALNSGQYGNFSFAVMIDGGAMNAACGGYTVSCVKSLVNYISGKYIGGSSHYARDNYGHAMIPFFPGYNGSVIAQIHNDFPAYNLIFMGGEDSTNEPYAEGGYFWVHAGTHTYPEQNYSFTELLQDAQTALNNYYNGRDYFAGPYKGFNDSPVNGWGQGTRYVGQQCGQTWLGTFQRYNQVFYGTRPLEYVQLTTWNDYEEGTELETGIDNCLSVSAGMNGSVLQWGVSGSGNENTIDHYHAYISLDGQNLMPMDQYMKLGMSHSFDLSQLPLEPGQKYAFFIKAEGKPFILNHMSNAVWYTAGQSSGSTGCAVNIFAPWNGQTTGTSVAILANTQCSKQVVATQVYDGVHTTPIYQNSTGSVSTTVSMAPGTYNMQVKAWMSDGSTVYKNVTVTVTSGNVVQIISPTGTSSTSVLLQANVSSPYKIDAIQVYDGVHSTPIAQSLGSNTINTRVNMASGQYRLEFKAWQNGTSFSSFENVTVQ